MTENTRMPYRPVPPLTSAFALLRIINLRRRGDRRRETRAELARLGEAVDGERCTFTEAAEPSHAEGFPSAAVRGCFLSHLGVLEEARDQGADSVLVMEDDVAFVRGAARLLAAATRDLAGLDWDIAYLGHARDGESAVSGWQRVSGPMRGAHCYAVNGGALSTFIAAGADVRAYYYHRSLAYQRPSRTDLHRPSLVDRSRALSWAAIPLRWIKRRYLKLVR